MKVKAKQSVEVELDEEEVMLAAISLLNREFNLSDSYHLYEGNVCRWEEERGHNTEYVRKVVRKATMTDTKMLNALEHIRKKFDLLN